MKATKLEGDKVPGKRIKSTDSRKVQLVSLFKQEVSCCAKVTELSERPAGFYARCLSYTPVNGRQKFTILGVYELTGAVLDEQLHLPKMDRPTCSVADALLAGLSHELLEKLVYHLAATSSECESCDDPAEVLRVIKLALDHPQITG